MFKVNPLDGNAKKDGQDAGALGSDNAKHRPGLGKTAFCDLAERVTNRVFGGGDDDDDGGDQDQPE